MSPAPEPRIGDAERDAATTALGEHYTAGRLTKDEYDERSDVALRARTESELRPLFVDLPGARSKPTAPPPNAPRAVHQLWRSLPLAPLLVVLVVLTAVIGGAWWLLFIVGWMFCCGPRRQWRWQ